jgi:DNA-binding FadR family transcriptional regulator
MQQDPEGRQVAFMGERRLVEDTGLSQSTVRRAVKELREAGVIKTSPGGVTRGHPHRCNGFELIG